MSEPKTRYRRGIEVLDPQVKPLTRYQRLDRVLTTVFREILAGSDLSVEAKDQRIHISLGSKGSWEFPTLELGLRSIGDLLEGNIGAVTTIEGECPGVDPIDQELLAGSSLSVSNFGGKVKVCWIRSLPEQEVQLKSRSHRVTHKGVRTLIQDGSNPIDLIRDALSASERIEKGSNLQLK
jgi:hypothetical protein